MQTIEMDNMLNLALLSASSQQELIDFYQFLVRKYTDKSNLAQASKTIENKSIQELKGVFNHYADTSKLTLENSAWEQQLLNKYRHD